MGTNSSPPPQGGQQAAPPKDIWGQIQQNANSSAQHKGKSEPPPPDYKGAAEAQAGSSAANVQAQTQANRPDQTNAFGASSDWTQNPDGSWTQKQSLSPELQGIRDTLTQQTKDAYGKPLDDGSAARQHAIDASYGQATSRLNPQWDQRQEQVGAQLANMGLDPNSQAYQQALRQFGQDRNDAYGSAMNSAIGEGNQAQALTFAQNMATRNAPGQELAALNGFLTMPGFQGAGMADPTQYLAATMGQGNWDWRQYQGRKDDQADFINGLTSIPGALIKGVK